MKKLRVHELAKELGKTSQELIKLLLDLKVEVKNHMSALEDEIVKVIKELVQEEKKEKKGLSKPFEKLEKKEESKKGKEKKKEEKIKKPEKEPDLKVDSEPPKQEIHKERPVFPEKISSIEKKELKEQLEPEIPKKRKLIFKGKSMMLREISEKTGLSPAELIKEILSAGLMITINQAVEFELAKKVLSKLGFEVEQEVAKEKKTSFEFDETPYQPNPNNLKPRPPVVTIMGHVDHGKTKLLDVIRKTNVVDQEAGNITQHIGAYQVKIDGKKVVFLDTPGHEAFTAMRARGTRVTDIAVLVVAADDGVMPQTIEAIDHAKAAGVPIIVAINKIDKPEANIQRVKQQLSELGLVPEEWGGQTVTVPISAKLNQGINDLLEMILLVAEMQELSADPDCCAHGVVVEAKMDRSRGPVATVLIRQGTLRVGDNFWCGCTFGRVRAIFDDRGNRMKEITPGLPGEVLGFASVPQAGDILRVVQSDKIAREYSAKMAEILAEERLTKTRMISLENVYNQIQSGEVQAINLILKADVQGSIEAIIQGLSGIQVGDIRVNIIHAATGEISESDVMLASASKAVVVGFNVGINNSAREMAEEQMVECKFYNIIYNFLDDIKLAMEGLLKPEYEEVILGRAEVRNLFTSSKVGTIAGCYVLEGKLLRGAGLRIFRGKEQIFEGKLDSLRRFKDDVREVQAGFECGVSISNFNNFSLGDILVSFELREKPRKVLKN